MTYVQDPSMPSGWRWQYQKPQQTYVPEMVPGPVTGRLPDGTVIQEKVASGKLMPSIKTVQVELPDGTVTDQPVANTLEEVIALGELEGAKPPTMQEKLNAFQREIFYAAANKARNEELAIVRDLKGRKAIQDVADINDAFQAPASVEEYQQRLAALRQRVASMGWQLVMVPRQWRDGRMENAYFQQEIAGASVDVALLEIRDGNGMSALASGGLEGLEKFTAFEMRARAIEAADLKVRNEEAAKRRATREAEAANDPQAQVRELRRKLAKALGEPDPEIAEKLHYIPGGLGAVGQLTVNGVPVDPIEVV